MDNFKAVVVVLGLLVIILIFLDGWRMFSKRKSFQNRNQGLTFLGFVLSILGFVSILTTFFSHIYYSLINAQGQYFTLLEGYNMCNSWMVGFASAISEEFLNVCRTVNMFFYLSIISLILGIIFIIIGLIKRK